MWKRKVPKVFLSVKQKDLWLTTKEIGIRSKQNKRWKKKKRGPFGSLVKMQRINYIKPFKKINDWNRKLSYWYGYIPRKTYKKIKERITLDKPFYTWMERRLDVVLVRLQIARSIKESQQLINHGHIKVNNKRARKAGYFVPEGSYIESTHPLSGLMRYTHLSFKKHHKTPGFGTSYYIAPIGISGGVFIRHPHKQEICLPRFPIFGDFILNKKSKIK